MSTSSKNNGSGFSQNGSLPSFPVMPPTKPARSKPVRSKPVGMQALTQSEQGVAAPDALPRPEHPNLGGTLYISTTPARGGGRSRSITKEAYTAIKADLPLRTAIIERLEDDADHATERGINARQITNENVKIRRKMVAKAAARFVAKAAKVQAARDTSLKNLKSQLDKVEDEIAQFQLQAMQAHSKTGVPSLETRQSHRANLTAKEAAPKDAPVAETENDDKSGRVARARETAFWVIKAVLGAVLGLALGENLGFLKKDEFLSLEPMSLPWMMLSMMGGASILLLASAGIKTLWESAGYSMVEEAAYALGATSGQTTQSGGTSAVRTLRHTFVPALVVLVFFAIESSIFRNAIVRSPIVTDTNNLAYWLAGLPFVFPTAIDAGTTGWKNGKEAAREHVKAHLARAFLDGIMASPEAQAAFAIDDYIETLQARRKELLADIDAQAEPYDVLLAVHQGKLTLSTEPTDDEKRILAQMDADAIFAVEQHQGRHDELADVLESLPGISSNTYLTGNSYRIAHGVHPVPTAANQEKLSVFQRFIRFLSRPFKKKDKEGAVA